MKSDYKHSWFNEPAPVRRKAARTPWAWGVEEFKSRKATEAGICWYLCEELDNRHLGVLTHAGIEYHVQVTVALVKLADAHLLDEAT